MFSLSRSWRNENTRPTGRRLGVMERLEDRSLLSTGNPYSMYQPMLSPTPGEIANQDLCEVRYAGGQRTEQWNVQICTAGGNVEIPAGTGLAVVELTGDPMPDIIHVVSTGPTPAENNPGGSFAVIKLHDLIITSYQTLGGGEPQDAADAYFTQLGQAADGQTQSQFTSRLMEEEGIYDSRFRASDAGVPTDSFSATDYHLKICGIDGESS